MVPNAELLVAIRHGELLREAEHARLIKLMRDAAKNMTISRKQGDPHSLTSVRNLHHPVVGPWRRLRATYKTGCQ